MDPVPVKWHSAIRAKLHDVQPIMKDHLGFGGACAAYYFIIKGNGKQSRPLAITDFVKPVRCAEEKALYHELCLLHTKKKRTHWLLQIFQFQSA